MKMMGHRGARDRAPENTLRSFEFALQSGVKAVEFDIHETLDGMWVVHHDDTLNRTTTSEGKVAFKTWTELSEVRTKEGDPLPRLEEVLKLFSTSSMELQIELKSFGNYAQLGDLLRQFGTTENITVISFNHRWLLDFKNKNPQIKTTCLLFGLPTNPVEIVQAAKANGLSLSVNWIDSQLVKECHAAGLSVTAWNANDVEVFGKMKEIGVDYLGTDVPFTALHWN
ncbi:glycerophosphodiester phosphodiesterase [Bdellovibrio bacteriovorus]|uniref:glycerophosphodiester phosphodiesterase n=1 Tax=Bdellovibrio bacteriovorus TaxID=959 RepID=UPI0021D1F936|nr:glycerophosphodiester phosphodiesterase [Bdellovibrio bacteriovorus]UXR63936.1 glycerophosphodiester phosphodiesterase [Bdellovibrio bacteriovorus]